MPLRAAHKTKAPGFAGGYLLGEGVAHTAGITCCSSLVIYEHLATMGLPHPLRHVHNTHNYGNVFIEYGIYDIEELPVDVKTNVNTCSVEHLLEKCYGRNFLKHIEAINPTEQMESSMAI